MQAINKDDPGSPCRLFSIRTDGTNLLVLAEDCCAGNILDLSADGQVLTFLEGDVLITMHADGTDKKQVVTIEEVGGSGSMLKAVNTDGSNIIQLTRMEEDNNALLKGFSPYGW
jgi:hypothetical protein